MHSKCFVSLLISSLFVVYCRTESNDCFRAAVYEHYLLGNASEDKPSFIISKNLDVFEQIVGIAAKEVTIVCMFPKYCSLIGSFKGRSHNRLP